jgi:hypothetical protein
LNAVGVTVGHQRGVSSALAIMFMPLIAMSTGLPRCSPPQERMPRCGKTPRAYRQRAFGDSDRLMFTLAVPVFVDLHLQLVAVQVCADQKVRCLG